MDKNFTIKLRVTIILSSMTHIIILKLWDNSYKTILETIVNPVWGPCMLRKPKESISNSSIRITKFPKTISYGSQAKPTPKRNWRCKIYKIKSAKKQIKNRSYRATTITISVTSTLIHSKTKLLLQWTDTWPTLFT